MAETLKTAVAVIGIDIGKNSFHIVGQDRGGSIVLRQKWSRGQVEAGQDVAASMLAMACWRAALDQNQGNAK